MHFHLRSLELSPSDLFFLYENFWEDWKSKRFRIKCEDPEPWGKPWKLVPLSDQGEADGLPYLRKVTFALFPPEEGGLPVVLDRSCSMGQIIAPQGFFLRSWGETLDGFPTYHLTYTISPAADASSDQILKYLEERHNGMDSK